MENLIELNTKPIVKKQKVFLDKEFPFVIDNKQEELKKANAYVFRKAILERDKKYHLEKTENSFKVNYRNKKAEMLR